ncbi:hypothetical protein [Mycobacterium sp.]|uniref:hypothetical protein n=1 Tax=Mycobacterium sp. TaxID=1785 RepID=UPI0025FAE913|nr:hypothetical protein [Mycobacterium sp.]
MGDVSKLSIDPVAVGGVAAGATAKGATLGVTPSGSLPAGNAVDAALGSLATIGAAAEAAAVAALTERVHLLDRRTRAGLEKLRAMNADNKARLETI